MCDLPRIWALIPIMSVGATLLVSSSMVTTCFCPLCGVSVARAEMVLRGGTYSAERGGSCEDE